MLSNISGGCFGIGFQSNKQLGFVVLHYCMEICAVVRTLHRQRSAHGLQLTGLEVRDKQIGVSVPVHTFITDSSYTLYYELFGRNNTSFSLQVMIRNLKYLKKL